VEQTYCIGRVCHNCRDIIWFGGQKAFELHSTLWWCPTCLAALTEVLVLEGGHVDVIMACWKLSGSKPAYDLLVTGHHFVTPNLPHGKLKHGAPSKIVSIKEDVESIEAGDDPAWWSEDRIDPDA